MRILLAFMSLFAGCYQSNTSTTTVNVINSKLEKADSLIELSRKTCDSANLRIKLADIFIAKDIQHTVDYLRFQNDSLREELITNQLQVEYIIRAYLREPNLQFIKQKK